MEVETPEKFKALMLHSAHNGIQSVLLLGFYQEMLAPIGEDSMCKSPTLKRSSPFIRTSVQPALRRDTDEGTRKTQALWNELTKVE